MRRILGDLNQILPTQIKWLDALVCEQQKLRTPATGMQPWRTPPRPATCAT
jgi:hypothetical protein